MINVGQAVGYLDLDISGFSKGIASALKQLKSLEDAKLSSEKKFKSFGSAMTQLGGSLSKNITFPLAAIGTASVAASVKFESAFAGVRKTVDATKEQFMKLEQGIKDLSERMPQSAAAIAEVAEAAGQLGIKTENILGFTETMMQLGDATNMTSVEAATSLARLANIVQMPQDEFDKLGSVIVELGNNLATTEAEIVDMSLGIAAAGKQVGLTEAQILAFAGALSSVGIESAAGGTAISKLMIQIQLAAETGSKELESFAQVAGMTTSEFATLFEQDAAKAITTFIAGLNDVERNGMSAIAILDNMGFTEVRLRDTILRAAGAGDLFNDSLEMGSKAWKENIALQTEAEKRYETTESKMAMLKNQLVNIGIEIGDELVPMLVKLLEKFSDFLKWFKSLDSGTKSMITKIALLVASIGPLLIIIGKVSSGISVVISVGKSFITFMTSLAAKTIATTGSLNAMTLAQTALNMVMKANPYVLVASLIAGIIAAIVIWTKKTNLQTQSEKYLSEAMKESINQYEQSIDSIDKETKSMEANVLVAENLVDKLYSLESQEGNTTEKKQEMKTIIDQLNEIIPDLNLSIDDETGKLNLQRQEVDALIVSYKNLAYSKAYSERMTAEAEKVINATENMQKAEEKLQTFYTATKKSQEDIAAGRIGSIGYDLQQEIASYQSIIDESNKKMNEYQNKILEYSKTNIETKKEETESVKENSEVVKQNSDESIKYIRQKTDEEKAAAKEAITAREKAEKEKQKTVEESMKAEKERYESLIGLNTKYAESVKETNEKLEDDIKKLNDAYEEEYNNRVKQITSSMGMFDKFTVKSEYSGKQLIKNLKSQVDGLKEWRKNLDILQEKGVSEALLEELQNIGPSAAGEVKALSKLTEKQLEEYVALWEEKTKQAQEQARIELTPLREETDAQIQEAIEKTVIDLQELQQTYKTELENLGILVAPEAKESGIQIIKAIELGVDETEEELLAKLYGLKKEVERIVASINDSVDSITSVSSSDTGGIDGSHANGLSYVPYDNYVANLHEGERVLTKKENEQYNNRSSGDINITMKTTGSTAQIVRLLKPEFRIEDKREGESY